MFYQTYKPHTGSQNGRKFRFLFLMTLTFDLWSSSLSERGTKDVFRVNLAQIRLAVPEIFHTQTQKSRRQHRTLCSSLRAVAT